MASPQVTVNLTILQQGCVTLLQLLEVEEHEIQCALEDQTPNVAGNELTEAR